MGLLRPRDQFSLACQNLNFFFSWSTFQRNTALFSPNPSFNRDLWPKLPLSFRPFFFPLHMIRSRNTCSLDTRKLMEKDGMINSLVAYTLVTCDRALENLSNVLERLGRDPSSLLLAAQNQCVLMETNSINNTQETCPGKSWITDQIGISSYGRYLISTY